MAGNVENPTVSSNQLGLSDRKLREMMRSGDKDEMKKNRDVFHITGVVAWTVRPPYWRIALATNAQGDRFLSDDVLDRVLPQWKLILNGERIPSYRYPMAADSFKEWLDSERRKARRLGKPWTQAPPVLPLSLPTPKTAGAVKRSSSYMSPPRAGGYTGTSSFDVEGTHETLEIRVLRELVKEVRDLKRMLAAAMGGNMIQCMTPTPQDMDVGMGSSDHVHGSAFDRHHGASPDAWYPGAQRYPTEVQPLSETSGANGSAMPELMERYPTTPHQHPTPASMEEEWQQWPDTWEG